MTGAITGTIDAAEATRRRLTPRQAAVVARLVDAAAAEARAVGYEHTTVRTAARRAGVAPATAYTYFASKDHLLAEVLWRRMEALPELDHDPASTPMERLAAELRVVGLFMADDTRLAAACTTALLGSGPEVFSLRARFGAELHRRITAALGDAADPRVLQSLDMAWSGAMLWAGMGHMSFEDVPGALTDTAHLLLPEAR
ncbi:MAG TPA: TetR/AcrR family transcriptional regulator [Acidimicrobiales bacterium]|nr:TetR/AcrR family transcriptional regulator [Acidimicrobiales bacterium]